MSARIAADDFLQRTGNASANDVRNKIDEGRLTQIMHNRKMLEPIVDTILTCARQNLPLRGHRDSGCITSLQDPVDNDGNLRALLRYRMRGGDKELEEHLLKAAGNAMYIRPQIQNALLDATLIHSVGH